MPAATLAGLLLAGAALSTHDRAAVDAVLLSIYQPYSHSGASDDHGSAANWEQPIFSAETTALIRRWVRVQPKDGPDDLNDGDWFCMCQDYENSKFRATIGAHRQLRPNVVQVQVSVDLGTGDPRRSMRFILNRESGTWKVDNLFARDGFENGLKVALRRTIAADQKLPR
jgi:Protein of unknown function (DUF3828)